MNVSVVSARRLFVMKNVEVMALARVYYAISVQVHVGGFAEFR